MLPLPRRGGLPRRFWAPCERFKRATLAALTMPIVLGAEQEFRRRGRIHSARFGQQNEGHETYVSRSSAIEAYSNESSLKCQYPTR